MADEDTVSPAPAADSPPPASTPGETGPSPSPQPSTPETSTDTGRSKESILDAVLKVVPATNEADVLAPPADTEAPPEATEPDSQQAEDEPETETDEEDEESPQDASPKIRKKINKLLKQRREARAEIASLRPAADVGTHIQNFSTENNLTGDDVAKLLQLGASLRAGDYKGFYEAIAPYVRTAQEALGIVLPTDLAQAVKQGQMTEKVARDYAQQRISGRRTEYQLRDMEAENQRQAVQAVSSDVKRAVSSFESRLAASDPDYKVKAPIVRRVAQALLAERGNKINSVEEALALSQEAYNEVSKNMRASQPAPRATHPYPNGASQTPSARAAPKTLMEAALQGLEQSRRGG
jgi:hypothetical protein